MLASSKLRLEKDALVLSIDESRLALATGPMTQDLALLAEWLEREPVIEAARFEQPGED